MARGLKSGLNYFPLDIDFFEDEKIEFVSAIYGSEGELITIKLLAKIYRQGYFIKWDQDQTILFSRKVNSSIEIINGIISELLKRDFLNKDLFKKYSILTSKGIQERYFEAVKRRKEISIFKEYLLVNVNINPENVNINSINDSTSTQSKVKKSKVKERKELVRTHRTKVLLTEEEYKRLQGDYDKNVLEDIIDDLEEHIVSKKKGKDPYSDHNLTIRKWLRMKGIKPYGNNGRDQGRVNLFAEHLKNERLAEEANRSGK